ncbi:MAG: 50S ribosomal protein L13 [Candidatus Kerfeldbacteria bacterium]|nr:50S ribosomal protein L13 [Candidatus Kerfeldbacteria bacterium]
MKPNQPVAEIIKIDAKGKVFGRLASQVAILLRGKNKPGFKYNVAPNVKVVVTNLSSLGFTGTKLDTKIYYRFSGYPGGIKKMSLGEWWAKQPERLFRHTVKLMLPKNRLSARLLTNLKTYSETEK